MHPPPVRIFCLLLLVPSLLYVKGQNDDRVELQMLGMHQGSYGATIAINMAVDHINARSDILPGYRLKVFWVDTACNPGIAVNSMYRYFYQTAPKIMILGASCSPVSESVALTSQLWNVVMLSYLSGSPSLSDTEIYKLFFRLTAPRQQVNNAHVGMMEVFNWKRVATLHQPTDLFSKVTDDLAQRLPEKNMSIITSEIFTTDPTQQINNLKRHDARIIFVGNWDSLFPKLFCSIYKQGLYGQKYVWVVSGFSSVTWWRDDHLAATGCTIEQLTQAAEGIFSTIPATTNHKVEKGMAGYTQMEVEELYSLAPYEGPPEFRHYASISYDTAWTAALALNNSVHLLQAQGKRLEDFDYKDTNITQAILDSMKELEFKGVMGLIKFDKFGDNSATIVIKRVIKGEWHLVGHYIESKGIDWKYDIEKFWESGHPPRDSTTHLNIVLYVSLDSYITMSLLAGLAILLSLVFAIFNFYFRNKRMIKMSSPRMNNVIIVGCMITYITVFLQERSEEHVLTFCKARTYILMIGFSMAFGALFAKTWRVYAIFMNQTKRVVISDWQLLLLVLAIMGIDFVILIVREVVDPMMAQTVTVETSEEDGGDILVTNLVWICTSTYDNYFKGVIYTIKGLLLVFGAFLAWQTRTVKIPALNDSQYIGVCIYNVAVLSLLGVVLAFALQDQVTLSYILSCTVLIFGTMITELIIFIPKMVKVRFNNLVEDEDAASTHGGGGSNLTSTSMETKHITVHSSEVTTELKRNREIIKESQKKISELTSEVMTLRARMSNKVPEID